jgi:cell wall-associated NlpC family hydrolase
VKRLGAKNKAREKEVTFCEKGHIRSAEVADFVVGEAAIRSTVVQRSHLLLGAIYSWGGRSAFSLNLFRDGDRQFTGLDCSGFASILYRSCGV